MGPRSDNRGYVRALLEPVCSLTLPSMGPRSDNRGYVDQFLWRLPLELPSMGPRSDNRGYDR